MTIGEYLNSEVESTQKTVDTVGPFDAKTEAYYRGRRDAYRELIEKLPEMEHEVTLREFKEFCKTHKQCSRCSVVDMCRFDCPRIWDIEETERRMRYEGEKRREKDGND